MRDEGEAAAAGADYNADEDDDDLEISTLRPQRDPGYLRRGQAQHNVPHIRATRAWQALTVVGVLALLGIALSRSFLPSSTPAAPFSTPVPAGQVSATETPPSSQPPTPAPPLAAPTAVPGVVAGRTPAQAPASCGGQPAALTFLGPPWTTQAIGHQPVQLSGFDGPYPTARLGPEAAANAYGWTAPHTAFGWPAPIGVALVPNVQGPVILSGRDLQTGYPLWFGLVEAGVWDAPLQVTPRLTLDPAHPPVPAGGNAATAVFWYGYLFFPSAGCYTLTASWPGGGWRVTVSAGR